MISRCLHIIKQLNNQKGQSLVEIALITPIVLVALYVPADFGIALFTGHLTQNAAREGARIGSTMVPFSSANVDTEVANRLPVLLKNPTIDSQLLPTGGGPNCMTVVRVSVTGNYNLFWYQLIRLLGLPAPDNSITVSRTTEMRYEAQPVEKNMC